jgi:4,5-DOPA dioxygenase extradiol
MRSRMPVLFVGHGSPMSAIEDNEWSRAFRSLTALVPRPRAILMVSAHWYTDSTLITGNEHPQTVHDFCGFPRELYEVRYPAPGDVELARRVQQLIGVDRAKLNGEWGLDHGAWSVLRWMYPSADIPVIQLSIDSRLAARDHFDVAHALAPLRDENVLVIGSGNITHNLRDMMMRMRAGDATIPDWAKRFDDRLKEILTTRDKAALLELWPKSDDARRAHPTPDHFLPVIYSYAVSDEADSVSFPIEGFDYSASMRAVLWK